MAEKVLLWFLAIVGVLLTIGAAVLPLLAIWMWYTGVAFETQVLTLLWAILFACHITMSRGQT